ncbi:MAG: hypothetical protein JJU32_10830 [Phormidium sp. BM_Day4_Bin.17]|nr:hypothetical protein [Phormidium sp. BM_Day4_Bin.17]UCJ10998.1 MAG: hypothetical protein JWS08_14400 [Phormidium sp. PBR-2020]
MRFPQPLLSVMSVAIALSVPGVVGRSPLALAQLPACAPPRAGEFLVLVLPENNQDLQAIGDRLPNQVDAQACTYLDEVVLRIHGFEGQEDASALARQITEASGLNAFVTRPPSNTSTNTATGNSTPPASSSPAPRSSSSLNLPQVQVIEARPAGGRSPSRSPEQTQPSQPQSQEQRGRTSRRSDENAEAPDVEIGLGDLPPANLPNGSFDVPAPDSDPDDLPVYIPVDEGDRPLSSAPPAQPQTQPQAMPEVAVASPPGRNRGFNPQPLEAGYAILVDYFNQPDVARELQRATNRSVGLVSYGQRPYLLVGYSRDEAEANALLQRLSEQGFWTMVVDSQRVMVLTPQVSLN